MAAYSSNHRRQRKQLAKRPQILKSRRALEVQRRRLEESLCEQLLVLRDLADAMAATPVPSFTATSQEWSLLKRGVSHLATYSAEINEWFEGVCVAAEGLHQ